MIMEEGKRTSYAKLFTVGANEADVPSVASSSYETAPLLKSVSMSENSEATSIYYEAINSLNGSDSISQSNASMQESHDAEDIKASLHLPSTRLSSFSSLRSSYDYFRRNRSRYSLSRSFVPSLRVIDEQSVSTSLTIANLLPFLLGSATFALPYSVALGGYATIPSFVVITILADITGLLLVDALYDDFGSRIPKKRARMDYVELARVVAGKLGARTINFTLIFYLYAMNTVNLVLIGRSFHAILNNSTPFSLVATTAIFSLLVLPPLFIKSLSKLAYLSMMSTICIITGGIASQVVFIKHREDWTKNIHIIPMFDGNGFAYAMSVWFFMLICHSVAPQIENSMKKPQKFPLVLHISHCFSALIKVYFGISGALTFGKETRPLVSMNIEKLSAPASVVTNAALAGYAVTSFPINFYVVCETFDLLVLKNRHPKLKKGGKYYNLWVLLTRPILVGVGLGVAVVIPYFGLLVGILGSLLAIFLVFIFPCWFHLSIKGHLLPLWKKLAEALVMVLGVAVGLAGLYASVRGLIFAMKDGQTV